MEIKYINYKKFNKFDKELTAAIGNFDGLHLGHAALINEAVKFKNNAVITFSPHPSQLLLDIKNYKYLTPLEKKEELLSAFSLDYLLVVDFDNKLKNLSIMEFISFLRSLNIKRIVCGFDFTFGYKGLGTVKDLEKYIDVVCVPKVAYNQTKISSSFIKKLLQDGNLTLANKLLNRNYSISGKIIYGNQVGRTIGYRTANFDYKNYFLPKNGVYAGYVIYKDIKYAAMINIGNNPTLNYVHEKRLEAHIIDFDADLYGEVMEVFFLKRLREEIKFDSKEELLSYLDKDKEDSIKIFNESDGK